jgi:hypothetical protein
VWYSRQNNQWNQVDSENAIYHDPSSVHFSLRKKGNKYSIYQNGVLDKEFVFGEPISGTLVLEIRTPPILIDNLMINKLQ